MAIISDSLVTVFQTSGVSAMLSAMKSVAAATGQITAAQARLSQSQLTLANSSIQVFTQIVRGVEAGIKAYTEFGNEVMKVRDLTGGSARDAAAAVSTFRLAGVSDLQQIREILHLSQAVFSAQGRAALGRIGVAANPNVTGLRLFNQIADALDKYPDGIMKAQIATEIFGARSVAALLPLLRLTHEQRERAMELGEAYNTRMLPAVQQFQFAIANLGETIMVKLIFPIVEKLLPTILKVVEGITWLVDKFYALDKILHGALSGLLSFVVVGAGIWSLVRGAQAAYQAFLALNALLKITAGWDAIIDALSGNWGALAAGIAAGAAVGLGFWAWDKFGGDKQDKQGSSVDKFGQYVHDFGAAINQMGDWRKWSKGGVPSALDEQGMSVIWRQMALGAIG